jgi:hypothetical protein
MVKIRYAELPAGLHVATEDRDGCTIVFLLPGLTPPQRRAALTFARRSARIGHGPSLPAVDMAFAVAADRSRTTGRTFIAVLRRHPVLLLPLVAVVSTVIVITMMSFVTVSLGPVKFPATDPAPPHRTGGPAGSRPNRPRPDPAAPSPAVGSATHGPVSTPTSVVQPAVVNPMTLGSGSDTPAVAGESAVSRTGRLCVTVGRTIICLRS